MPMKSLIARIYDALRSRRLAVGLLVALAVWSALGTVVPQRGGSDAPLTGPVGAIASFVGLDHAFSAPAFLLVGLLLFLSTTACSIERTRAAVKIARRAGLAGPVSRPDLVVRLGGSRSSCEQQVADALRRAGLRVRTASGGAIRATSSHAGLAGSPVFHWLLAALIVLVAAGQLTRSEGLMGVPVGSARVDEARSYGVVEAGPLHSRFTSLVIAVPSIAFSHVVDGIDRGPAPYVELRDGPYLLKAGHVYPNRPLRYRSLTIHANEHGLAVPVAAQDGSSVDVLLDFDEASCVARSVSALEASGPGGATRIMFEVPLETYRGRCVRALPREPRIIWRAQGPSGEASSGSVRPGGSFEPLPGVLLRVGALDYYARLSVVDDWSVYPMYVVFALATLALALAVFMPYREASAAIKEMPDGVVAQVQVRHARRDPGFMSRVREELERVGVVDAEADRRSRDDD